MPTMMLDSPVAQRIGRMKGEILAHAMGQEVLGITGKQHNLDKNTGDTVIYRSFLPRGAALTNSTTINTISVDPNLHLAAEGVAPDADTLIARDVTVTIQQYACLYMYTDRVADMHEDDIPEEMITQTGERMGMVREMIRYGGLRGCTNRFYAGGTTRATVDQAIDLSILQAMCRSILANHGRVITRILSPSPDYGTSYVEASFLVFAHTDLESDIRKLPDFVPLAAYGQRTAVHENEIGSCDRFRFVLSPDLFKIPDSGAATGSTGLLSAATKVDIYPAIVVGMDAWGDLALRGRRSFAPIHQPASATDKSDPLGQRGYVGAKFYSAAFVQNDGWMSVLECGATNLTP